MRPGACQGSGVQSAFCHHCFFSSQSQLVQQDSTLGIECALCVLAIETGWFIDHNGMLRPHWTRDDPVRYLAIALYIVSFPKSDETRRKKKGCDV